MHPQYPLRPRPTLPRMQHDPGDFQQHLRIGPVQIPLMFIERGPEPFAKFRAMGEITGGIVRKHRDQRGLERLLPRQRPVKRLQHRPKIGGRPRQPQRKNLAIRASRVLAMVSFRYQVGFRRPKRFGRGV